MITDSVGEEQQFVDGGTIFVTILHLSNNDLWSSEQQFRAEWGTKIPGCGTTILVVQQRFGKHFVSAIDPTKAINRLDM